MSTKRIGDLTIPEIKQEALKLGLDLQRCRESKSVVLDKLRAHFAMLELAKTTNIEDYDFKVDVDGPPIDDTSKKGNSKSSGKISKNGHKNSKSSATKNVAGDNKGGGGISDKL